MPYESQADELINNLRIACEETLLFPNSWLPDSYHNHKTGFVGVDTIHKKLDKKDEAKKPSQYQQAKQSRLENIALYADQAIHEENISYDQNVDEAKKYENMQSFCKYCPSIIMEDE
jgi:hypothetical protein|tara:strand:+ start:926 stop:1276 length:351 start_codon:yes stop_codon:yes gene_type:complete